MMTTFRSRRPPRTLLTVISAVVALGLTVGTPAPASASVEHPTVVIENPENWTPALVPVNILKPTVDAIGRTGNVMVAGGNFERLTQGGQAFNRRNLVVFDASTGAVSPITLNPNGRVWAVATIGEWVYVGGEFSSIGGVARPSLARFSATTGVVDPNFRSGFSGRVNAIVPANGRLYVGGSFTGKVVALDPVTGANTHTFGLPITNAIPGAWGSVSVYSMAINPAGTKLVATGNFQTVAGQSRTRFFMADLNDNGTPGIPIDDTSTLSSWYYTPFSRPCSSTHARRIAYLQGIDFAPDGSYFAVVSTGQISRPGDKFVTVCDGAARFDMDDDTRPAWINYTGGDSVWSVAATGAAVYVQGHFQWLDNPNGFASQDGGGAAQRYGIGAIDPVSGLALPWNPPKRSSIGGKATFGTAEGLWVGSESPNFNGEPRRGLAFLPLP